jgi:hypothetical protein
VVFSSSGLQQQWSSAAVVFSSGEGNKLNAVREGRVITFETDAVKPALQRVECGHHTAEMITKSVRIHPSSSFTWLCGSPQPVECLSGSRPPRSPVGACLCIQASSRLSDRSIHKLLQSRERSPRLPQSNVNE